MGLTTAVTETERARANHLREENERLRQALQKILDVTAHHLATSVIPDGEGLMNWVLNHVKTTLKTRLTKHDLNRIHQAVVKAQIE